MKKRKEKRKLEKLLTNNTFLINSSICIVVLLSLCYLGFNKPIKETYSLSSCNGTVYTTEDGLVCRENSTLSGKWVWKDTLDFSDLEWQSLLMTDNTVNADVLQFKLNNGQYAWIKDKNMNFTAEGENYESLTIFKINEDYWLYYDKWYTQSEIDKETIIYSPHKKYVSGEGTVRVYAIEGGTHKWDSSIVDRTIDFGTSSSYAVSSDFYTWFTNNAEFPTISKCYYDSSEEKFIWTDEYVSSRYEYSIYTDKSSCESNNKMKVVLKDSAKTLQDCTSGICGVNTTSVTLKLYPGRYKLNNTTDLQYKIEKYGYKLSGWKAVDNNGNESTINSDGSIELGNSRYSWTLTAIWRELERYKVKYDANGGTNAPSTQDKTEDEALVIATQMPERDNYIFEKWSINKDGTGISYQPGDTYNLNQNVTLYAQWISTLPDVYTVTYDANGGINAPNTQTKSNGETLQLSRNIPVREGYEFVNWDTKQDGTGTSYEPGEKYYDNKNLTLYAQWKVAEKDIYAVSYDANGGTNTPNIHGETVGKTLQLSSIVPVRDGYEFLEWNTNQDGTGTGYAPGEKYYDSISIILYAQWTKPFSIDKTYTVDENNKYITANFGIIQNEFQQAVTLGTGYEMDVDVKLVNGINVLHTNGKLQIKKSDGSLYKEYSIVVLGDVDGDGALYYSDYVKTYNHVYKTRKPSSSKKQLEGIYAIAGDYSNDGNIEYDDYVKIFNKVKEIRKNGGTN